MVNLYGNAVIPQFIAYCWLPVITYYLVKCVNTGTIFQHIGLTLSIAALILTHMLVTYMFMFVIIPFTLFLILRSESNKRILLSLRIGGTVILGALLASCYLLPAIGEGQYLNLSWFLKGNGFGDYHTNFMLDHFPIPENPSRNYLHFSTLFCIFIGLLTLLLYPYGQKQSREKRSIFWGMIGILFISLFMAVPLSIKLWEVIPQIAMIQFPSRWLTIAALAIAYLVGDTFDRVHYTIRKDGFSIHLRSLISLSFLIGVIGVSIIFSGFIAVQGRRPMSVSDGDQLLGKQQIQSSVFGEVYAEEYRPKWSLGASHLDYSYVPPENSVRGDHLNNVFIRHWTSTYRDFTVTSEAGTTLHLHLFWFPGWYGTLNAQSVNLNISAVDGTIELDIPRGVSEIKLTFEDTPIRILGNTISLLAVLFVLLLGIFGLWRSKTASKSFITKLATN